MSSFASHILPALDSFGIWSYWIVGLAAFLEGWWVTGVMAPGTLVVDAGGALVRLGHLDFFDLTWFVAIGAMLGGEASWHSGRWLGARIRLPQNRAFFRAEELIRRHGPLALVIGRFLGPVASLAALAAALSGMDRRRFVIWNIISGIVYALVHVAIGYLVGDVLARLTPYLPRLIPPLGLLAAVILVTWAITRQARRGAPLLRATLTALRQRVATWPPVVRFGMAHPRTANFIADRLDPGHGGGLLATGIAILLIYLIALLVDGTLDLALVPATGELDQRVSNLAHAYWSPLGLEVAAWVTQLGRVPVAALVAVGTVTGLALFGRRAAAFGLAGAVLGNSLTVTLLKLAFGRERPELAYFLETSNSFPSGHAAISVALYGSLALMLWRERLIGPTTAIVGGVGLAIGIGLTRIYLIEHYLSDVLNGWIVGTIWMVIGLAIAEGVRRRGPAVGTARHVTGIAVMIACFGAAGWVAVHHRPSPAERSLEPPAAIADLPAAIGTDRLPLEVVTLGGDALPPVSAVSAGLSVAQIADRLIANGWLRVPAPDVVSVVAALRQDLTGHPNAGATAPAGFRASRPADATLHAPGQNTVLRLWEAGQDATAAPIVAWAVAPEVRSRTWSAEAATTAALAPFPGPRDRLSPAPSAGTSDRSGAAGPLILLKSDIATPPGAGHE
ncbi:bifunctional DedA family/phosphatase PAP2 family protein [Pseudodonghicola sp.]|uniref:bifunctional DedA family/phosphatase PAP2 family protein n=1 Tax=Pseudodonghicola sp. TaxID=1969463 RepID=UPI003A9832EC